MEYLSIPQWLTFIVILYSHLLAPTLPGPIETIMKNPLTKTFGLFWLLYQKTRNWKFSLLVASGLVVVLEGACYMLYGREAFGDFHRNRWCPSEDHCIDETAKSDKVLSFLNDNDKFIDNLYKYVNAEAPEQITVVDDDRNSI